MVSDQTILTRDGLDKLNKELEERLVLRRNIAQQIEEAKALGDLSENFEYQEAKEQLAINEGRILALQSIIKTSVVSDGTSCNTADICVINLGSKIKVRVDGKEKEFKIVSFNEADPVVGAISNESPLGRAFLGHQKGDKIDVVVPRGTLTYEIVSVE